MHNTITPDSGYATEDDVDEFDSAGPLCVDSVERDFAVRWLTGFIRRADELSLDKDTCERFVDDACSLLSHLNPKENDQKTLHDNPGMTRHFEFSFKNKEDQKVTVEIFDMPMQTGEDHTDVGLQTWGASIALSERLGNAPESFGLERSTVDSTTRIIELGAGTGLVNLVLSSLLPCITDSWPSVIATDYHPAVLNNLKFNIASHVGKQGDTAPMQACHLDWSAPSRDPPLHLPADVLIAADVVYAPEHAKLLRDCAADLLAPNGVFWLMVSVRPNGKFAGIGDTVEAAFADKGSCTVARGGRRLAILDVEWIDRHDGVGRADEIGYKLFKIGWN
ncbi:Putative S-adenosylmethionine-dependent methyltransferase [Tolypocladium paradoxum]|uniref:S-adenosylmethionine-dependent methyltransferase n=1 Tax=Tolypocladium paradoxum TaxID=94208 RepID=A0A2S4KRY6_9HYPO|nr:Putative S-adenosylmethionine-dependent methyltransferase [Tolypocladium paradoxum]